MPTTVILNIEANGLDPKEVWCATTIDIETGEEHVFRNVHINQDDFLAYMRGVVRIVGHNACSYDIPVLSRLTRIDELGVQFDVVDTLVVSRLLDFSRDGGHSLASWSEVLKVEKTEQPPWEAFSEALVDHSLQNCRITLALYKRFLPYLNSKRWRPAIDLEHFMVGACREINHNGFHFNLDKARELRYNINIDLEKLDAELLTAFPPTVQAVRSITPRFTKFGTLNRNDFRWAGEDLSYFNGGPFTLIEYQEFNPGSPVQIVSRLNEAGWKPEEKTKGHITFLRDVKKRGYVSTPLDEAKAKKYAEYGWKVSETNLDTLPDTAPEASKSLAKRIKYASRVRVLDEWIANCREDSRIHGTINPIGAWTHRCSHDKPNTGNIPRDDALFGMEFRSLWDVDSGHLVGVDAEGIQLRVLAHYINDEKFTAAVTEGKKELGTDPHSLNKLALGDPCKSRNDAKTFIYAWLLGAGVGKVGEILGCSYAEAKRASENFIEFYPGLREVKRKLIPTDASRGYFEGFDGRYINIFGEDQGSREHFALAGYLQAGEAIVMKTAMGIWLPKLKKEKVPFKLVNFVHDEWQTQVYATREEAKFVAEVQAASIKTAGEVLGLRCPMAGSILSGHGGEAIGQNWYETH